MKTYVINLAEAADRKVYMQRQLEKLPFLSSEFITAVDGRRMSEDERKRLFDAERFRKYYLREVRPGEIGCTLSHQKCYKKLAESADSCALILEDDIVVLKDIEKTVKELEVMMATEEPRIVLLSGWYWYLGTRRVWEHLKLARVYDAFLTHAYVINRSAARLLMEERPFITADDWRYIRRKGICLQAILPHLVGQEWSGEFQSFVNVERARTARRGIKMNLKRLSRIVMLKGLILLGRFEKA